MIKKAFAVKADDEKTLLSSSSGGAFSLLSKAAAGSVFGARWNGDFRSVSISESEDIGVFRGSKYLRADLSESFSEVKKRLEESKTVLFSACPCQVAALKKAIPESLSEKLFTVDFICHGMPEPEIWDKYLSAREKDAGAAVCGVSFRNKDEGWRKYSLKIDFENGKSFRSLAAENPYWRGYISDLFVSEGCTKCIFKDDGYKSDVTLADFWGGESLSEIPAENGLSLVICHTDKGLLLAEKIENAQVEEIDAEKALAKNPSYFAPTKPNVLCSRFLAEAKKRDIDAVLKKYTSSSKLSRIRLKLLKIAGCKNG